VLSIVIAVARFAMKPVIYAIFMRAAVHFKRAVIGRMTPLNRDDT
jgi:hypothetical protein